MTEHFLDVEHTAGPSSHRLLMPHSSIAGSVSGLSVTSRTSRVSHATTIRSVATLTDTLKTKTGLSIPILPDAIFTNVQRGSVLAATYSIIQGLFAIVTGCFDIYSLSLAAPGSSHYGFYLFSYDFVYSGNPHVRNSLMLFGGITAFGGVCLIVTSVALLQGLRKEIEFRMEPWIWCMALFTAWRILITIYSSIVNDMVFAYHVVMCLLWLLFIGGNTFAWLVVHSFYHELCEVTRLEDVARVKMDTMSTMGFSSRPTTPGARSTISTQLDYRV
ncbi:uncharacterized protein LOC125034545 isoform X1 [Penaeus chinensis]|uniref:uncharacterized protein LOC125034545 isoform X1 n=2 Tax=Penaeus chinensis TaxID=139456 RepID=UPI001FB6913B|nr:uncharacterized protein LOC125034545 isoform X1 [Penaeus chinensis]XP_047482377.1 uncharacterized protein LOC125034545 isoform X1 [Penaeus chinensis]XP_047482378.1 uncharacterized protein LOC125034545 isoform X1 [Penaeus chinensis]